MHHRVLAVELTAGTLRLRIRREGRAARVAWDFRLAVLGAYIGDQTCEEVLRRGQNNWARAKNRRGLKRLVKKK